MKYFKKSTFIIIIMITLLVGNFLSYPRLVQGAYTKAGVQKKIKSLKKEIKKLEKSSEVSKENDKNIKKGLTYLMFPGKPISREPFVFEQPNLLGGNSSYYWVLNPGKLDNLWFGWGWVKPTGKYRYYGNIICTECTAIKTKKPKDNSKKIKKLKKELSNYETMLEDSAILADMILSVGEKKKIKKEWDFNGKGNTLKFRSSNSKVATIDKKGLIVAKKAGRTTISATASLSGITTQCEVVVRGKATKIEFEEDLVIIYKEELKKNWKGKEDTESSKKIYSNFYNYLDEKYGDYNEADEDRGENYDDLGNRIIKLKYRTDTGGMNEKYMVESQYSNIAEYNPKVTGKESYGEIKLIIKQLGGTDITIKTASGLEAVCHLEIRKERITSIEANETNFRFNLSFFDKNKSYTIPLKINDSIPGKIDYFMYIFYAKSSDDEVVEIVDEKYFKLKKEGKATITLVTNDDEVSFDIEVYNDPNEAIENTEDEGE